ncbi:MAG: hypothetical protein Q9184_004249 [Pyrenodesmia sp. 2 TL-2023]
MEPPLKRRRLFTSRNPDDELHKRRSRCDMKLKSRFESIFAKYSKDFSDVGDVIDFQKDEIVINNGHVRNMVNETDPGDQDGWPVQEADVSSSEDSAVPTVDTRKKQSSDIIPDSQHFDSSDDDPLGRLEQAIQSRVSGLSQLGTISSPNGRQRGSSEGKPKMAKTNHTFEPYSLRHVSSVSRIDGFLRFMDESSIEEAWRVPLLPEDSHVRPGLPSPSPSEKEESESSRSASPPGLSIWAPERRRNRSAWTQDEDRLLTYYRTRTDLNFEAICECLPGRSASSLRVRWGLLDQETKTVAPSPSRNSWTPEENQLLRELKTSTNMNITDIQRQIPRHSQAAISSHWHLLRQKLVDKRLQGGRWPPAAPTLPSVDKINKRPLEHVSSTQDCPTPSTPARSTSPVVKSHSAESYEARRPSTPILAAEVESDHSEPQLGNVEKGQRRFPSGTIVADSQEGRSSQHHVDESLDQRAYLEKFVTLSDQENDHDAMPQILPPVRGNMTAHAVTKLKARSTCLNHRLRHATATDSSRKRKRVDDNDGEVIEEIKKNPKPATGMDHDESGADPAVDKPATGENLVYLCGITGKEVIVIDSSPEPPSFSLGSQSGPEFTNMDSESTNYAFDNPGHNHKPGPNEPREHVSSSDNGTNTQAELQQPFAQSLPQRPTLCVESKQERLDQDQPRTPEGESRSRIHSLFTGQMRGSPRRSGQKPGVPLCRQLQNPVIRSEDWERIRAEVRSREAVPSQKNISRQVLSSPHVELPLFERIAANNTASEPSISSKGQMPNVLGSTKMLPTSLTNSDRIGSAVESPVAIALQHHDVTALPTLGNIALAGEHESIAPNSDKVQKTATEPSDNVSLSAVVQTSPKDHSQGKKAISQRPQESRGAAASSCERFRFVEIPMLSSATSVPHTAPLVTGLLVNEVRGSSLNSAHSSNGVSDEKLPGFFTIPDTDDNEGFGAPQGHEDYNLEPIPPHAPLEVRQETNGEQQDIGNLGEPKVVIEGSKAVVDGSEAVVDESKTDVEEYIAVQSESKTWPEDQSITDESRFVGHSYLLEASPTFHKDISPIKEDEDDLQLSLQPVFARGPRESRQRTSTRSACRLVLQPKYDEADMSDDELSTPLKAIRYQVEMTPVRALKNSGRRPPTLF